MFTDNSIWWHVYPLAAVGAPIHDRHGDDSGARLRKLEPWLDYAADLGVTGLLLGPMFESATHGYDTLDHYRLDRRLGGDAEWDRFVAAARERGLDLILDGVFNHVSVGHPWVQESVNHGGGMVHVDHGRPRAWEGVWSLAELNHHDPRVADHVEHVMKHWLHRGAAGWRLDVAYAVPTWFWAEVLGRVRAEFPDTIFTGEVIHGDYAQYVQASTLDAITQYELWKGVWSSLADRNLWELAAALDRHARFSDTCTMQTFIGNHDVERIASRLGDQGAALAATLLLTLPGLPSIYYGDEQAFRGEKGHGHRSDEPLRPALPDSPEQLAPFGWWLHHLYRELIALRRANPWIANGRVHVTGKDNRWITYEVTGEGHTLRTHLQLDDEPGADGQWHGHQQNRGPVGGTVHVEIDGHERLSHPGVVVAA